MESTDNDNKGRILRVEKLLSATVDIVWESWTDPAHIANWWGPDGFTNTIHVMNFKDGGEWRLTMHGPDGKNYPNRSVFREIVPFKKMVFQHFNPGYLATIIFEPDGKATLMEWTMLFETAELYDTVVKVFKADEGLNQNVEKLENYLKKRTQLNAVNFK